MSFTSCGLLDRSSFDPRSGLCCKVMEGYQQLMARVLRILKISFGVDLSEYYGGEDFLTATSCCVTTQVQYTSPYTGMDG